MYSFLFPVQIVSLLLKFSGNKMWWFQSTDYNQSNVICNICNKELILENNLDGREELRKHGLKHYKMLSVFL